MIKRFIDRWRSDPPLPPAPHPKRPMAVIGDIHGRLDLLEALLEHLTKESDLSDPFDLITVGDMVDRGPDSQHVVDLLRNLTHEYPNQVTALKGNHEAMMLEFLDGDSSPEGWLRNGGIETLHSFGVELPLADSHDDTDYSGLRNDALEKIGPERIDWLRDRPSVWQSGNVIVVHAAFDRQTPSDAQDPNMLLWGARAFYATHSISLPWVVHGHVISRPPQVVGTRVAVDSGAWLGGGLTAAIVQPGEVPRLLTIDG